ncbi:hypothetical protein BLOT_015448 [Blomia tropicalis]|nr:hypothetical protein BLOT_015448 [Blomia tropicalis]
MKSIITIRLCGQNLRLLQVSFISVTSDFVGLQLFSNGSDAICNYLIIKGYKVITQTLEHDNLKK